MVMMVVMPVMPMRFEGAVTVPIGPIRMATIGRITIVAVTITIGRPVMAVAGKTAAQSQQQEQHRKRQGDQAHQTPPLIHPRSREVHPTSMAAAGLDLGIFMMSAWSPPQFNRTNPREIAIIQHPILRPGKLRDAIRAKPPFIARAIVKAAPGRPAHQHQSAIHPDAPFASFPSTRARPGSREHRAFIFRDRAIHPYGERGRQRCLGNAGYGITCQPALPHAAKALRCQRAGGAEHHGKKCGADH